MKNSNNTIENRSRNLPVFSTVPQPAAPPRTPVLSWKCSNGFLGIVAELQNISDSCQQHINVLGSSSKISDTFVR
jgi:hypothetical protein